MDLLDSSGRSPGPHIRPKLYQYLLKGQHSKVKAIQNIFDLIDIIPTRVTEEAVRGGVLQEIILRNKEELVRVVTVRGEKVMSRLLREGNKAKIRTSGEQALTS